MRLNDMSSAPGSRRNRKRIARGSGSGLGKTAGRGQKGQKSRSGGKPRVGFEGGQMPLQRRLPKFGFNSRQAQFAAELRLDALNRLDAEVISIETLKGAKLIAGEARKVKIFSAGQITRKVVLKGLSVTKGARRAIELVGGSIED